VPTGRAVRGAPPEGLGRVSGGAARGVAGRDDRAEVLRVERAGLPFGERRRWTRLDADAGVAEGAVEDVGAVPGGGHPGVDGGLRRGQPHRAPGDVLADYIPGLRARQVAAGAHPVERRLAVGGDVGEVVFACHVAAVLLRGARELRVGRQRALAVAFAFLVDQAQHRGAHLQDVARVGGEVGVGTGARRGRRRQDADCRERARAGGEREQHSGSGTRHEACIGPDTPLPEPARGGLDTF
jgi:hypothetical protein